MDKRIIFLIIIFWVGSLGFFLYRKLYYKPEGIRYSIRPNEVIRTGDSILYQDNTPGANRWKWDFGDGEFSANQSGQHLYLIPGKFNVRLTVYGAFGAQRDEKTFIDVMPSSAPVLAVAGPSIAGPAEAIAGQSVRYEASLPAASYEWKVEGDPSIQGVQKSSSASFAFSRSGVKTIVLTLHNPDHVVRKTISVMAAPQQVQAPKPMAVAPAPRPAPVQHPRPHPATEKPQKGNGLPDIGEGVEYKKK